MKKAVNYIFLKKRHRRHIGYSYTSYIDFFNKSHLTYVTVSKYLLTVTLFSCPEGVNVTEDACICCCVTSGLLWIGTDIPEGIVLFNVFSRLPS